MVEQDSQLRGREPESGNNSRQQEAKPSRRGRVIIKEIGEQTRKKTRWNVTLLRHKRFDTVM